MKADTASKPHHWLDNLVHLLLIVIAVGALGLAAWEVEADAGRMPDPDTMITPPQRQFA